MFEQNKKSLGASSHVEHKLTQSIPFRIVEAYKNVRTSLLFSLAPASQKSIVVSSAEPDTGKSTTCSNLAITMSQTGARVLLIDADMRKPVQHKIFQVNNTTGLSELLGGFAKLNDVIHSDVASKLDLITAGPIPPNPSELLGSESMEKLLEVLSEHYDYIFIDTPPINVVADSLLLCGKTAGTLLVARQKQTTYDELDKTIDSIKNIDGNILGVVITDVKEQEKSYGYYNKSYKSYDYRYGRS